MLLWFCRYVKIWDVMILIPNILFLFFLLFKIRHVVDKFCKNDSPMFTVCLVLVRCHTCVLVVVLIAVVNVSCVVLHVLSLSHTTLFTCFKFYHTEWHVFEFLHLLHNAAIDRLCCNEWSNAFTSFHLSDVIFSHHIVTCHGMYYRWFTLHGTSSGFCISWSHCCNLLAVLQLCCTG